MSRRLSLLVLLSIAVHAVSGYRHTIKLGIRMEGRASQSEQQRRDWVRGIVFAVNQKTRFHDLHIQVVDLAFMSTPPANLAAVQAMAQGKAVDLMQAWTSKGPTHGGPTEAPGAVCTSNAAAIIRHIDNGPWLRYDVVQHRVLRSILNSIGISANTDYSRCPCPLSECPCPQADCVTSASVSSWSTAVLPNCTRFILDQKFKNRGCTSSHKPAAAVMSVCGNGIREAGEECDCTVHAALTQKHAACLCCTTGAKECQIQDSSDCKKPASDQLPPPQPPTQQPLTPETDKGTPTPNSAAGKTMIYVAIGVVVTVLVLAALVLFLVLRLGRRSSSKRSKASSPFVSED